MRFCPASRVLLTASSVIGALLLSSCAGRTSTGTEFTTGSDGISTVASEDRTATVTLKGQTLEGKSLDVVNAHRGKTIVINVWGSWCPPCRAEAPLFDKVAREKADDGVVFVGINTRDPSRTPPIAFQSNYGVSYPSLYDPTGKIVMSGFPTGTLNPQALPATVVLDRDGRIAARYQGPLSAEKLRKMIDPVVAEK
ncbi:redoxin family protein [Streptomyces sp. NPDC008150]|uniref:TlpA family protein disulfide reductase n=1 Tax=Streptomyces sp. NPDC008150 TaxID=3364816 RepID=UPI0036E1FBA7